MPRVSVRGSYRRTSSPASLLPCKRSSWGKELGGDHPCDTRDGRCLENGDPIGHRKESSRAVDEPYPTENHQPGEQGGKRSRARNEQPYSAGDQEHSGDVGPDDGIARKPIRDERGDEFNEDEVLNAGEHEEAPEQYAASQDERFATVEEAIHHLGSQASDRRRRGRCYEASADERPRLAGPRPVAAREGCL